MVRSGLLWLVLLGSATPAWANTWAENLFDERTHDFGSVPRGQLLTHAFRVMNRTGQTVHISGLRVSCGCTSVQTLQTTLAPGQETAVFAQMDTRRFVNSRSVTIFVQFDQPQLEEVRLWLVANSRDDLAILPDTLALGRIKHGQKAASSVTVSFLGSGGQIVAARSDSNYIHVEFRETRRDFAEVAYQVSARIRSDAPPGKWYTTIWLETGNPAWPRIRVPLTVEIDPIPTVVLGLVKAGGTAERKIILRGATPFRVTGVSGTDAQIRLRDTASEGRKVHVLKIKLRPTNPGLLERTIRVTTDVPGAAPIEFNARAQVVR